MGRRWPRVARLLHIIGELGHDEPGEDGCSAQAPPGAALWLPAVGSGNAAAPGENPA